MSAFHDRALPALNVDTSVKKDARRRIGATGSPPRTPTRQGTSTARPPRETFLDDITPVVDDRDMLLPRDSHDLSLHPQQITRNSLVDNMLLSLDQMQFHPSQDYSDGARSHAGGRQRGYSHDDAYSSDLDPLDDTSRYSSPRSRDRRSNSSSTYAGTSAIHSRRDVHARPGPSRMIPSRDGRASKGSSANSVDLGYTQNAGSPRWGQARGRSSSVDLGQDRATILAAALASKGSIASFAPYDYDAAPTPTVPGGPRRPPTGYTEQPSPAMPQLEKMRSAKSSKPPAARPRAENSRTIERPPVPSAIDAIAAPAPTVGYGKQKPPATPVNVPKERSGFLRRVFGGSSKSVSSDSPVRAPPADTPERGSKSQMADAHSKSSKQSPAAKQPQLTKKSSSFFRLRKRSMSELEPPLPTKGDAEKWMELPTLAKGAPSGNSSAPPSQDGAARRPHSPVSSLRKVMNPYLHHQGSSTSQKAVSDGRSTPPQMQRHVRGFSPGYEPDQSATIRQVRTVSGGVDAPHPHSRPPVLERPNPILRSQSDDPNPSSKTFLHDSSDNDYDPSDAVVTRPTSQPKMRAPPSKQSLRTHGRDAASASVPRSESQPVMSSSSMQHDQRDDDLEDDDEPFKTPLPFDMTHLGEESHSTSTVYKSATSLPIVQIEGEQHDASLQDRKSIDSTRTDIPQEPTSGDRERAKKVYDGNEDFIQKHKAAAWMGDEGVVRHRTLVAYMELYDFANQSILGSLRLLCSRLVLKGETQQVDRILDQFSKRWCECNPDHGFKLIDVVHTICYSILLLNTDLHLADIESKMTRSQFIKNTMTTVRRMVQDSVPESFDRLSMLPPPRSQSRQENPVSAQDEPPTKERASLDGDRLGGSAIKPPPRADSEPLMSQPDAKENCGPLVHTPFKGTLRAWEQQVELVLRDTYNSIRHERLPLFGAEPTLNAPNPSQSTLSVFTNGFLRRTPSVLSKTPSETQSYYVRGRPTENVRFGTGKWAAKSRSRPRLYPHSTMGSSRTSLDDQSVWSPGNSSSWGKTNPSMSVDSFGSGWGKGDARHYHQYQQSIGFANALSQAIIREDTGATIASNGSEDLRAVPLLEDESLELVGAPWAKEGIVKHKHHLEAIDKKARDRNWGEVFAVIEKGYMSLFSFSTKSMRNKTKGRGPQIVGGGNWQENAEKLGSFLLRQTIASALPPPGYSKSRPHVWALSLPTGAVHLFQVGTPEIVKEFVTTANYWSARLSNHPLIGGISNIEYGWSDAVVSAGLVAAAHDIQRPSTSGRRPSLQGSIRSSLDQGIGGMRARLPGDKITISDWNPPQQSMQSSNLLEADQLHTLTTYVKSVEHELQKHNQLRSGMLLAFSPRHPNSAKAMANWEKKSAYLLREIVKFRTYIDCLQAAEDQKQKIYKEREARRELAEESDKADQAVSVES